MRRAPDELSVCDGAPDFDEGTGYRSIAIAQQQPFDRKLAPDAARTRRVGWQVDEMSIESSAERGGCPVIPLPIQSACQRQGWSHDDHHVEVRRGTRFSSHPRTVRDDTE